MALVDAVDVQFLENEIGRSEVWWVEWTRKRLTWKMVCAETVPVSKAATARIFMSRVRSWYLGIPTRTRMQTL